MKMRIGLVGFPRDIESGSTELPTDLVILMSWTMGGPGHWASRFCEICPEIEESTNQRSKNRRAEECVLPLKCVGNGVGWHDPGAGQLRPWAMGGRGRRWVTDVGAVVSMGER
jgi:hypothetical protein